NTVVDDTDSTTVTLSSSTNGQAIVEGGSITYTASVGAPVTGSDLVVALSNGQSITIAVGQSSGTATFAVRPDDLYVQGTQTLATVSIAGTAGGNFEALATTGTVANTVVDDTDSTTVTLSSSTNGQAIVEGGSITYTASVGAPVTGSDLVVALSNGQSITIAVGQSSGTATFAVRPDDLYVQGTQTLATVSIAGTAGGNFEALATTGTVANTVVDDTDSTTVTLSSSTNGQAIVEGGSITYTASVGAPVTGSDLVVALSNGQSITIAVGQSSGTATFAVRPDDLYVQGTQTLATVSIAGTAGGNFEALATTGTVANTVVDDTDSTTVTLSSSTNGQAIVEGGSITYTASVGAPVTGSDLVVALSNGQSITIAVGQSSGTATFAVRPDDLYVQGTQTLATVSIAGTAGGNFEALATTGTVANTVVDDTDSTTVTLSSSTNGQAIVEGGSITYTASVGAPVTGSDLVVALSNGQSITIAVGQSSGTATFAVRPDDLYVQGTQTLATVSIAGTAGGNFEALATTGTVANTVVDDTDSTTVTLSSSTNGQAIVEGGSITYTASVGAPVTGSDLVVALSNGQSITIAVGQSSGTATFAVRPDDLYVQGTQTLATVSIAGTAGGNFEALATTGTVANTVVDDTDSTTVTLSSSTNGQAIVEGGSITYTASVGAPVTGSDLVVALSNGQSITIAVGQSSGTATFAVRPDDLYVQGTQTLATVSIAGTAGGNFEALATTGTVANTVVDDTDSTTVTLSSSTNGQAIV